MDAWLIIPYIIHLRRHLLFLRFRYSLLSSLLLYYWYFLDLIFTMQCFCLLFHFVFIQRSHSVPHLHLFWYFTASRSYINIFTFIDFGTAVTMLVSFIIFTLLYSFSCTSESSYYLPLFCIYNYLDPSGTLFIYSF